jgi:hypothetical protein
VLPLPIHLGGAEGRPDCLMALRARLIELGLTIAVAAANANLGPPFHTGGTPRLGKRGALPETERSTLAFRPS